MCTHAYLICPLRVAISEQQSVKVKGLGWASFLGGIPPFLHPSKLERKGLQQYLFVGTKMFIFLET